MKEGSRGEAEPRGTLKPRDKGCRCRIVGSGCREGSRMAESEGDSQQEGIKGGKPGEAEVEGPRVVDGGRYSYSGA